MDENKHFINFALHNSHWISKKYKLFRIWIYISPFKSFSGFIHKLKVKWKYMKGLLKLFRLDNRWPEIVFYPHFAFARFDSILWCVRFNCHTVAAYLLVYHNHVKSSCGLMLDKLDCCPYPGFASRKRTTKWSKLWVIKCSYENI